MTVDQEVDALDVVVQVDGAVGSGLVVNAQVDDTDDDVGALILQPLNLILCAEVHLIALREGNLTDQTRVDLGEGLGGLHAEEADLKAVDLHDGTRPEGGRAVRLAQNVRAENLKLSPFEIAHKLGIAEVELMVAERDKVIARRVHDFDRGSALRGGDIGGALREVAGVHQDDGRAALLVVALQGSDVGKAHDRAVGVVGVQNDDLALEILLGAGLAGLGIELEAKGCAAGIVGAVGGELGLGRVPLQIDGHLALLDGRALDRKGLRFRVLRLDHPLGISALAAGVAQVDVVAGSIGNQLQAGLKLIEGVGAVVVGSDGPDDSPGRVNDHVAVLLDRSRREVVARHERGVDCLIGCRAVDDDLVAGVQLGGQRVLVPLGSNDLHIGEGQRVVAVVNQREFQLHAAGDLHLVEALVGVDVVVIEDCGGLVLDVAVGLPAGAVVGELDPDVAVLGEGRGQLAVLEDVGAGVLPVLLVRAGGAVDPAAQDVVGLGRRRLDAFVQLIQLDVGVRVGGDGAVRLEETEPQIARVGVGLVVEAEDRADRRGDDGQAVCKGDRADRGLRLIDEAVAERVVVDLAVQIAAGSLEGVAVAGLLNDDRIVGGGGDLVAVQRCKHEVLVCIICAVEDVGRGLVLRAGNDVGAGPIFQLLGHLDEDLVFTHRRGRRRLGIDVLGALDVELEAEVRQRQTILTGGVAAELGVAVLGVELEPAGAVLPGQGPVLDVVAVGSGLRLDQRPVGHAALIVGVVGQLEVGAGDVAGDGVLAVGEAVHTVSVGRDGPDDVRSGIDDLVLCFVNGDFAAEQVPVVVGLVPDRQAVTGVVDDDLGAVLGLSQDEIAFARRRRRFRAGIDVLGALDIELEAEVRQLQTVFTGAVGAELGLVVLGVELQPDVAVLAGQRCIIDVVGVSVLVGLLELPLLDRVGVAGVVGHFEEVAGGPADDHVLAVGEGVGAVRADADRPDDVGGGFDDLVVLFVDGHSRAHQIPVVVGLVLDRQTVTGVIDDDLVAVLELAAQNEISGDRLLFQAVEGSLQGSKRLSDLFLGGIRIVQHGLRGSQSLLEGCNGLRRIAGKIELLSCVDSLFKLFLRVGRHRQRTVQEGDDLAAGAGVARAEGRGRGAGGDAVFYRPQHCAVEVVGRRDVLELVFHVGRGLAGSTPEERDRLAAGAGVADAEAGVGRALGDAVFDRPQHSVIVVLTCCDVRKGVVGRDGRGFAAGAPQESDDLLTRTGLVR